MYMFTCIPFTSFACNIRRQIILSDDAYKSIRDTHDRVQVFLVGSVLIRLQPVRFLFGNIEVLHIQ